LISVAGRLRQTFQFLFAWLFPLNNEPARSYLTAAEYALFLHMSRPERQHHLRVLAFLLDQGHRHPSLLKAALLHDAGKLRYRFSLPDRVLVVLVKALLPGKFRAWSEAEPLGWRRSFVISAKHPIWGAEMCEAIQTDSLAVDLIRSHQTHLDGEPASERDRLLALLQQADDRS